jgi:hypothetical protein
MATWRWLPAVADEMLIDVRRKISQRWLDARKNSPVFEVACVLVRVDHVASFIVDANHGIL